MDDTDFQLSAFLPYLLNQAAEETGLGFQKLYRGRYGLLRTEWRVLFHLGRYGELTAKEIGIRAKTHKTKVSRAIAALEKRRFLTRREDERDRRFERLALTAAGRSAFDDLQRHAIAYNETVLSPFSVVEREVLYRCLVRLARVPA